MGDWAFAPDWLTLEVSAFLSGHDLDTIRALILDGGVDAKQDGSDWLIDKGSLYEFQETLLEVWQWLRWG
jgi:hypothetical protein